MAPFVRPDPPHFCADRPLCMFFWSFVVSFFCNPAVQRQRQAFADGQQEEANGGGDRGEGAKIYLCGLNTNPVDARSQSSALQLEYYPSRLPAGKFSWNWGPRIMRALSTWPVGF